MNQVETFHSVKEDKHILDKLGLFFAIPVALVLIIAFSLVAGVILGYAWEGVCFLRSFNSPEMITDKIPSVLVARDFGNDFLNQVGVMLDVYNHSFPNNMRYGSGLGIIGGAIICLPLVERNFQAVWSSWIFRLACGATVGAIVGARLDLVFNSDPIPFLVTTVLLSVLVGIFAALLKITNLPHVKQLFSC